MVKNWGAASALLALIALIAVGLVNSEAPQRSKHAEASPSQYCESAEDNNRHGVVVSAEGWLARNRNAIEAFSAVGSVVFAGILAIFTGVLAQKTSGLFVETGRLRVLADEQRADIRRSIKASEDAAKAAERSAKIAEDALVTVQRAFVFLIEIDIDPSFTPAGHVTRLRIRPTWRNSGLTPTRNLSVRVQWGHFPVTALPPGIGNFDGVYPTKMFLAPQAQEWTQGITIPKEVLAKVESLEENVYVWGQADYEDIFDGTGPRFTQWCNLLVIDGERRPPTVEFVAYGDFNRSDEDARRKKNADG
jgi:hypothetical protein